MKSHSPSSLILHVCQDSQLLGTREMVLRSAGYFVESSHSIEDAIRRFKAGDFDLVLLCHTIGEHERQSLVDQIRNFGSSTPVVTVESSSKLTDCSIALIAQSKPAALLCGLEEVLSCGRAQSR